MKTKLSLIFSILSLVASASTWTFHGCKDNYTAVQFNQSDFFQPVWAMRWDWDWDQARPDLADSGISFDWQGATGYADSLTFEVPEPYFLFDIYISSPFPDYESGYAEICNGVQFTYYPDGSINTGTCTPLDLTPGEYWLDYSASGALRLANSKPTDFGKWAWDGSINPSWVVAKKGFGKGHIKQPLPSPK